MDTTIEIVKVFSDCSGNIIGGVIAFTGFFIFILIWSMGAVSFSNKIGWIGIVLSSCWFIFTVIWMIGLVIPLNVTKATQVQKVEATVVQVEGKLLTPEGITVVLQDDHDFYSKKNIKFDKNTKIQEKDSGYTYTEIKTKISYSTKHKIMAWIIGLPNNQSKTEMILTIPKGSLNQNE